MTVNRHLSSFYTTFRSSGSFDSQVHDVTCFCSPRGAFFFVQMVHHCVGLKSAKPWGLKRMTLMNKMGRRRRRRSDAVAKRIRMQCRVLHGRWGMLSL